MKKLLFIPILVAGLSLVACQQEKNAEATTANETKQIETTTAAAATPPAEESTVDPDLPKTTVSFSESEFDFGDIKQGDVVKHTFKFKNTGNEPLIISSAKGSCGCTVPQWPKEPVAPGAEGAIDVEFSSKGKSGNQTKTVTIQANTDPNPTRLTIKSNILVPEGAAQAAPPASH
ncbi:MAG: DUF1573 domain-containing protein [Chitinophagales bacterium]|nr:DUF1573 domain-containing protein [Bacteroidota bacterium]MCB9043464.1 DUF1573 domain-containing protein [Chitinophagales bacterium]